MRTLQTFALAASLSIATLASPAVAQSYSADVIAACAKVVGPMKFEGQPAERNKDMMTLACLSGGGRIPGGAEQPVALKSRQPVRR